jgi:hypothetical protein
MYDWVTDAYILGLGIPKKELTPEVWIYWLAGIYDFIK